MFHCGAVDSADRSVKVAGAPELPAVKLVLKEVSVVLAHHIAAKALEQPCDLRRAVVLATDCEDVTVFFAKSYRRDAYLMSAGSCQQIVPCQDSYALVLEYVLPVRRRQLDVIIGLAYGVARAI